MKFLNVLFFIWISILFSTELYAEELDLQPETSTPNESVWSPLHLKVGASLESYRYEEPGLISHSGILIGAWLNWLYKVKYYTGGLQAEIGTGRIDYDGALCDMNTNTCTQYKSKTNDLILRASHRFQFQVSDPIEIFAGLGYRYLYDKGEGAGFYRRIGQYWILPVGLTAHIPWEQLKTKVLFDFEYDFFLKGQMQSYLSDVNSSYGDIRHDQNRGRALRFILGFEPETSEENPRPWLFYLFYENWAIPESDRAELMVSGAHSGKYFYEPQNNSNSLGLRVGWGY